MDNLIDLSAVRREREFDKYFVKALKVSRYIQREFPFAEEPKLIFTSHYIGLTYNLENVDVFIQVDYERKVEITIVFGGEEKTWAIGLKKLGNSLQKGIEKIKRKAA